MNPYRLWDWCLYNYSKKKAQHTDWITNVVHAEKIINLIPVGLWASAPEDAASANASVNGRAQIKAEQKCWGYHAHTTKIDAERVRQRAKQLGLRWSVMCLVEEQENNADGHRNDGKQSRWSAAFPWGRSPWTERCDRQVPRGRVV